MPVIYHLARDAEWREAERAGRYVGTADDRRDGFLHFSTAEQVAESAARHRRGEDGILLIAVDAASLGEALARQGKVAEAQPLLEEAAAQMAKRKGAVRWDERDVVERLALLCEKQGKAAEAARWRAQLKRKAA